MKTIRQDGWRRRGVSLLWDAESLNKVATPGQVISVRDFFALRTAWPEDLPSSGGDAIVVAGLEGCLDALSPEDAATWLANDLKDVVLDFQDHYEGQAALVMWLPTGGKRVKMTASTERYTWSLTASNTAKTIELGRFLWGGAEADVARIIDSDDSKADWDGPAWAGLHHPRIS